MRSRDCATGRAAAPAAQRLPRLLPPARRRTADVPRLCAGAQPATAGMMPPSSSDEESSDEGSGKEEEQQPRIVMIKVQQGGVYGRAGASRRHEG